LAGALDVEAVANASQRQLIAAAEKLAKLEEQLEQLQLESLDKAPVDDAEIIQQLINARVAHAVWYTDMFTKSDNNHSACT
jgi:ribosomal 50S subunit-associated protein YjgA (DUF615 family)